MVDTHRGVTLWTFNACRIAKGDLIPLIQSFEDTCHLDVLCVQEGASSQPEGVVREGQHWVITGKPGDHSPPHLILNNRVGTRLRQTRLHTHYVIAEIGFTPPLLLFSLYLPPFSTHGAASFDEVLHCFARDLEDLQKTHPGSFVLGGADCNAQLRTVPGHIGTHVGTLERVQDRERADSLAALVATAGLKVPTTYVKHLGPTRFPWKGQADKQQASYIDHIFASNALHTRTHKEERPLPATTSDHLPVGLTATAPYRNRRERRRQFEKYLAQPDHTDRIPTQWAPGNPLTFYQNIRKLKFTNLREVPALLKDVARNTPSQEIDRNKTKRALLEGMRTATDPVIKQAYQIHLQHHRVVQREACETNRILAGARGLNWEFNRQAKIPTQLRIPPTLDGESDRGKWGKVLKDYLADLYKAPEGEDSAIHDALWRIQQAAHTVRQEKLECHPIEIRDILKSPSTTKSRRP